MDPSAFRGGEFLRFFKIALQRPLAIDMSTGVESREKGLPVLRNLDADGHDVDGIPRTSANASSYQCSAPNASAAARGLFSIRVATADNFRPDNFEEQGRVLP